MTEYFGLAIVITSVALALVASLMALSFKQKMDYAISRTSAEIEILKARQQVYTRAAVMMESAVSSVNKGKDYAFDELFNKLTPELNLHASEEINSCYIEVCLLLENWTAMRDDLNKTHKEIQAAPELSPQLQGLLKRQGQQESDACQLFQKKFSKMISRMRAEINPDKV